MYTQLLCLRSNTAPNKALSACYMQEAASSGRYVGLQVGDSELFIPLPVEEALTGGEIAGIVVGSFFGALIILVFVVVLVR